MRLKTSNNQKKKIFFPESSILIWLIKADLWSGKKKRKNYKPCVCTFQIDGANVQTSVFFNCLTCSFAVHYLMGLSSVLEYSLLWIIT